MVCCVCSVCLHPQNVLSFCRNECETKVTCLHRYLYDSAPLGSTWIFQSTHGPVFRSINRLAIRFSKEVARKPFIKHNENVSKISNGDDVNDDGKKPLSLAFTCTDRYAVFRALLQALVEERLMEIIKPCSPPGHAFARERCPLGIVAFAVPNSPGNPIERTDGGQFMV